MTLRAIDTASRVAALRERLNLANPVKAIALVMLAVSALVLGLTFYTGKLMDDNAISRQRALVDNALTSRLERGVGELRSVAWWDDAVNYSSGAGFDHTSSPVSSLTARIPPGVGDSVPATPK